MNLIWLNNQNPLPTTEPFLVAIKHDESIAYLGLIDDAVEHHILLNKIKGESNDLDNYYRIIVDTDGTDWTFVCPPNYKNITNKEKRIETFYKDGYEVIKSFLKQIGYPEFINIPKRYTRHLDYLVNGDY